MRDLKNLCSQLADEIKAEAEEMAEPPAWMSYIVQSTPDIPYWRIILEESNKYRDDDEPTRRVVYLPVIDVDTDWCWMGVNIAAKRAWGAWPTAMDIMGGHGLNHENENGNGNRVKLVKFELVDV